MGIVTIPKPAGLLASLVTDPDRRLVVSTARQIGKTNQFLRWLVHKATMCPNPIWENWYCAPTYRWAKRVAWRILKSLIPRQIMLTKPNNSELTIELVNGAVIGIKGMDRFDDMVGNALWSVVFDEFGSMKDGVWNYLSPSLANTNGWVILGGTPRPYGNPDFKNIYHEVINGERDDFKAYPVFKTADSPFVSAEFLASERKHLTPQMYEQEYEGSWKCFKGQLFAPENLDRACTPWQGYLSNKVRAWDLATTQKTYSDHTAGGLYGRDDEMMIFLDLVYGKWEYPQARNMIINTAANDGVEIPIVIEGVGGFLAVAQDIRDTLEPLGHQVEIVGRTARQDKLSLSAPVQAKIANDKFRIMDFPNRDIVISEWRDLTHDQRTWRKDDILDTSSMAYSHLFNYTYSEAVPTLYKQ